MPRERVAHYSFNRGEIGPLGLARGDVDRVRVSAETMINWLPKTLGPMTIRPGLGYLATTKSSAYARIIPFIAATTDTALIELTANVMRVWVNDAVVTRPSVSTSISNSTLTSATGWTDASTNGANLSFSADGCDFNTVGAGGVAKLTRTVTVAGGDQNVQHALNITVAGQRPEVYLRVGTSAGADNYIEETRLLGGFHSLAFTPSGDFHITIQCTDRYGGVGRVSLCGIDGSGAMELTTPWGASDVDNVRVAQSADVLFVACEDVAAKRIERRGTYSWSIVDYESNDGPFIGKTAPDVQLKVAASFGRTTITASRSFFREFHDGAIFRLFHDGQKFTMKVNDDNQWTDAIRVTGVQGTNYNDRDFTATISGTWSGTLRTQRSITADDVGFYDYPRDVSAGTTVAITGNTTLANEDEDDNLIAWYRLGFEDGEYTSGSATVALDYDGGGDYGVVIIDDYTSDTVCDCRILRPPRNTTYTSNWSEGAFSGVQGHPTATALHEGRLWWFAGAQIFGSVSDQFESFDQEIVGDSGPIVRTIGDGPVDVINWALPLGRLIIGTAGGEMALKSSSIDEPMTPLNFTIKSVSSLGSKDGLGAVRIDESGVFVHRSGKRLYEIVPADTPSGYAPRDLTLLHPTLLEEGVVSIAVQRNPDTRVHLVLGDGTAAILTYDRAEEVTAWSRVETGTAGAPGVIEQVAVLSAEGEDSVYYVVKRTINGSTVRYLEKWAQESEVVGGTQCKLLDSFVTYSGAATATISGLDHLEGEAVRVWANSDVVQESDGAGGYQPKEYTVSSGAITLSATTTNAVVGLGYIAQWKSTKLAYAAGLGSALTQRKRVNQLGLILGTSHHRGLQFGRDFTHMDNLPTKMDGATVATGTVHDGYDAPMVPFPGDWSTDSRICLQARAPYPMTVLAMVMDITTNG